MTALTLASVNVSERLSPIAKLLQVDKHGTLMLFIIIVALSILVYKLGFAQKLPIIKSLMIYTFLILGGPLLTFFGIFLPIAEGLVVAALILIIYKVRLRIEKKKGRFQVNDSS